MPVRSCPSRAYLPSTWIDPGAGNPAVATPWNIRLPRILITGLISIVSTLEGASPVAAQSSDLPAVIVLVRHAEKSTAPNEDPDLTNAGQTRAKELARALRHLKLDGIITSQLQRTIKTARPLDPEVKFTQQVRFTNQPSKDAAAIKNAAAQFKGKNLLVVSHSEIIDDIISALADLR